MKAIKMMMFVAAATMLFAACGKDKVEDLADNTLVYDGTVYHLDQSQMFIDRFHAGLTLVTAMSVEQQDGNAVITVDHFHIAGDDWNKTRDLANLNEGEAYELAFIGTVLTCSAFGHRNNGSTYCGGQLNGTEYEDTPVVTEGTLRVEGNNDGTPITVLLDCKLINGKELKMKLVTPEYVI
jgi:hypothetical protein